MAEPFVVKGINPATGQVVEVIIVAGSAAEARVKAIDCGLERVTARPEGVNRATPEKK